MTMKVIKIHAEAYRDRMERELRLRDESGWLHGRYVAQAIATCFSKQAKYPEKPYLNNMELSEHELTDEELRMQSEAILANFNIMQRNFEKTHPKELEMK